MGVVCALGALAFAAAGCGAQEHANEPRPQPPTRVSVSISEHAVTVQPTSRRDRPRTDPADPPEPARRAAADPQQPPRSPSRFVAANLTGFELAAGGARAAKDATSGPLVAHGNGTFQVDLPTGVYTIERRRHPRRQARPASRSAPTAASSKNDLLLP